MEYYQIIIYMLALSEFFKNNIGSDRKDTFLLLEPIILDILKNSPSYHEYIIQELNKLKLLNEENIITILGSFKSMKIIEHNQDNDSYCLAKNMEYIKNRNEKLIENKKDGWNRIRNYIINKMDKLNCKNIDTFYLEEHLYNFLISLFEDEKNEIKDEYIDVMIFLEACIYSEKDSKKSLEFIKDILLGIGIVNSIKREHKELKNSKLPTIYLDNIFIGNLLGWCSNIHFRDCMNIFQQLKNSKLSIKIHEDTFNIIIESMKKYKNMRNNKKEIKVNSFFQFMQFCDKNNKQMLNVDTINTNLFYDTLKNKLNELDINIDRKVNMDIDKSDSLYSNIEKSRKEINERKEKIEIFYDLPEEQTNYDYLILRNYHEYYNKEDLICDIPEIFLTYQQTILKLVLYDADIRTYNPIMHVRRFATLLLIENIILNINDNSKLLEYVLYNSYSDLLNEKLLQLLENVHENKKINTDDAKKIISNISCATCVDSDRNIDILKNEDETKIVSSIIKYKDKYREKVIEVEEANKKIEDANIEKEKIREEKEKSDIENEKLKNAIEKSDAEKNEVLKENEKLKKEKQTRNKIDKYRDIFRASRERKINRRNIKIIKIACIILISALISTLIFIFIKSNKDIIRIFTYKNIKLPDIVIQLIIFIIVNPIIFLLNKIFDKIKKKAILIILKILFFIFIAFIVIYIQINEENSSFFKWLSRIIGVILYIIPFWNSIVKWISNSNKF